MRKIIQVVKIWQSDAAKFDQYWEDIAQAAQNSETELDFGWKVGMMRHWPIPYIGFLPPHETDILERVIPISDDPPYAQRKLQFVVLPEECPDWKTTKKILSNCARQLVWQRRKSWLRNLIDIRGWTWKW